MTAAALISNHVPLGGAGDVSQHPPQKREIAGEGIPQKIRYCQKA